MNCPSRTDETLDQIGWNQSPPQFPPDSTTRQDLNGIANARVQRDRKRNVGAEEHGAADAFVRSEALPEHRQATSNFSLAPPNGGAFRSIRNAIRIVGASLQKFAGFIGPGFMVSVAYIDPGNYSTDVSAGATYRFKLLFIILMSNLFAIFLQSLCIKLGTVTGLNLAENCKAHCPKWLNITLYVFAETAIIATDIAEVIGSAIALNLLFNIPLVAGCAITLVDVLIILIFYRPMGSMRGVRLFELLIMALVGGVVVCFCIQLSYIRDTKVRDVFRGYIPSSSVFEAQGLYMSCGILGATVMPHSLYLGSGLVQSRVQDFDFRSGNASRPRSPDGNDDDPKYRPSIAAIKYCLRYSITELSICLFTFALFVNSSILIVAGASLYGREDPADLFSIYGLLRQSLAPAAGTLFALALLLSGTSAGIVCTIAGQMVSEGQLNWTIAPWMRRLVTRAISITPSIIIAAAVGKGGLSATLNATQVVLSAILPFVSAPLIYFTCRSRYMEVATSDGGEVLRMGNHWLTVVFAVCIWLVIVVMNVSLLVLTGLGKT